ncbi:hypothetical protein FO519_005284 [Halicephalobus sp. NKZ332]|nr:hypothetical protein FO519_005284 [Halicephalobus sp. NKZ332]
MTEPVPQAVRLVNFKTLGLISSYFSTVLTPTMQTLFASVLQALDATLTVAVNGFNGAIFLGTVFVLIFAEKIEHWLLLCICSSIRVTLQCALAFLFPGEISVMLLTIIGFCIGVIFSTLITYSIRKLSGPHNSLLVSVIYVCFAGGLFISSVLLDKEEVEIPIHPRTKLPLPIYPVNSTTLSNMHVHSRYPPMIVLIISAAFQGSSLYPFYSLWKSKNEQPTEEEEYHDINEENKNRKQILFLCCFIGLLANGLFSSFPYFLFSYNPGKDVQVYFTVFSVLCGFSVCIYSFEPARVMSSAIYGLGLSMINPVLTVYIGQLSISAPYFFRYH